MRAWWIAAFLVFYGLGAVELIAWLTKSAELYDATRRLDKDLSAVLVFLAVSWKTWPWIVAQWRRPAT